MLIPHNFKIPLNKSLYYYQIIRLKTTKYSESNDYQFLQRSQIPTLYFQSSLLRLPIPHLEKTCQRYLAAVEPIVNTELFIKTKISIENFRQNIGMELHAMLKQSDESNKNTSYISKPWFDMYLSDRKPLPLNYNPVLVFKYDKRSKYNQQLLRSCNLIISSLRFWNSLKNNLLEPEIYHINPKKSDTKLYRQIINLTPKFCATYVSYAFKAFPLDMSQYDKLFGVTRIPKINKDKLIQYKNSKHIIVMKNGNIYCVNVLNNLYEIEKPEIIYERLKNVIEIDKKNAKCELPLGCLTASERNFWANTRYLIETSHPDNKMLIEKIDSALFCLCLDGDDDGKTSAMSTSTVEYDEKTIVELMKKMLAGDATNRWFDKSISIIVDENGTAAINFEHSWGDGVAVLRYFNEIYNETIEKPLLNPNQISSKLSSNYNDNENVYQIKIHLNDNISNDIIKARKLHQNTMNLLNLNALRSEKINKKFCKNSKLSPDSIMQLAFQLTYRKKYHNYVGTYESCSTAAFKHGRTETMRPCTMETKNFCELFIKSKQQQQQINNKKELQSILNQCSIKHGQLTKEAAMGQGFDRHLFALKNIAIENNLDIPDFYINDEAYQILNKYIISTSTLGSDALLAGGFGPVVRDGIGIGYSIQNDECGVIVTSYKGGCDGEAFVDELEKSFDEIFEICR